MYLSLAETIEERRTYLRDNLNKYSGIKISREELDLIARRVKGELTDLEAKELAKEELENEPKYITGTFRYIATIWFEDSWENDLFLKCTYQRRKSLLTAAILNSYSGKYEERIGGYDLNDSWETKIEFFKDSQTEDMVKKLLSS